MTWFRADDKLHCHYKAHGAGLLGMGLWVMAGSWCADKRTDGAIPRSKALALCDGNEDVLKEAAAGLVRVDLWTVTEDGWQFHDWSDYQFTADEIDTKEAARREKKVESGRKGGLARASKAKHRQARASEPKQSQAPSSTAKQSQANQAPLPSPPFPSQRERGARAQAPEQAPEPRAIQPKPTDPGPVLTALEAHGPIRDLGLDLSALAEGLDGQLMALAPSPEGQARRLPQVREAIAEAAAELAAKAAAGARASPEQGAALLRRFVSTALRRPPPEATAPESPLPPGVVPLQRWPNARPPPRAWDPPRPETEPTAPEVTK